MYTLLNNNINNNDINTKSNIKAALLFCANIVIINLQLMQIIITKY